VRGQALVVLACAAIVLTSSARARADAPNPIDMQEHIFGASNVNAATGHGALTAGVSSEGDITVLAWPGPSYADQLAYVAGNDLDVRTQPHLGAKDGMGSFLGLRVATAAGTQLVWLRDPSFVHTQRFSAPTSVVPITSFSSTALGLTVDLTDIVSADADALTRHVAVHRAQGSPVVSAELVAYENLSPTLSRVPMLPFADWALDGVNDFAALYDESAHAIVHFHPGDRAVVSQLLDIGAAPEDVDYGPVDALMRSTPQPADVNALVAALDARFPPGVVALVGTDPAATSFQIGSDATPICAQVGALIDNIAALPSRIPGVTLPLDPTVASALRCADPLGATRKKRGWTWAPDDALADIADGSLQGSRVAAAQANGILVAPLAFNGADAEASMVFAFGHTLAEARAAWASATAASPAARQAAAEAKSRDALAGARLPDPALGDRVVAVAQRALLATYVAKDRASGAIVASIARQAPYYLDWPRDGSFITQGLDVAGLKGWGTTRSTWYATLQRTSEAPAQPLLTPNTPTDPETGDVAFPAGAWEMNYYADGTIGGNLRFEIDNTALHLWSLVAHVGALDDPDRTSFAQAIWPGAQQALDLLARWRDPATGLQAPANEDDRWELSATLHGATAVFVALDAGARLAHFMRDDDRARRYASRAAELARATLATYYDAPSGLFQDHVPPGTDYIPGTTGRGSTAWLAWPARMLNEDDPRLEAQLLADMQSVMKDIRGETQGGAYVMKNVVAAALLGKDGGSRALAREAVTRLANISTPDTMEFGEVFVTIPGSGGGAPTFSPRVSLPHIWEGMLFYLSAMALTDPSRFDLHRAVLPPPPPAPSSSGCETSSTSAEGSGWALALVALLGAVAKARRGKANSAHNS
jgi:MYXO-CTERM domain-containing protein